MTATRGTHPDFWPTTWENKSGPGGDVKPVSVRRDLQAHLAGRITTTGRPLRRWSVCQLCGLSSGPWLTLQTARISGLMHLASHHPDQTGQRP